MHGVSDDGPAASPATWSRNPPLAAPKFFRLAHLRKLRNCEKVAAICYRIRGGKIEFLLVQTRKGERWTFPKGSAEPGLTHAQAAALEAFEEAGVHGRMEEAPFTQYISGKRGESRASAAKPAKHFPVHAFLCEVLRLTPPEELNRNPTWFSPEKTRQRLRQERPPAFAAELARVVDRALIRIRRQHTAPSPVIEGQLVAPRLDSPDLANSRPSKPKKDALQKVTFINDARGPQRLARP